MKIDNYNYMNRTADDTQVGTRLLINGKIEDGSRIVKLPGYDTVVDGRNVEGAGTIQFDKVFVFKDPRHGYATQETYFAVWSNVMYWWNGVTWMPVEWNGQDPCNFDEIRFWHDRGTLHISGGKDGRSAIYQHIDRDPGADNGFFNNKDGFTGFWFGPEELPQFDLRNNSTAVGSVRLAGKNNKGASLTAGSFYYLMGVYNCDGKESIYKPNSFISNDAAVEYGFTTGIIIDLNDFDKRVTAIDLYGAKDKSWAVAPEASVDFDINKQDEAQIDWKFLKRLSINKDAIWVETANDDGAYVSATEIDIDIAASPKFEFVGAASLDNHWLAVKTETDDDWQVSRINTVTAPGTTPPDATHIRLTVDGSIFEAGETYFCKILSRWAETASGSHNYRMWILWLDDDDLGDPYDTIQAYSAFNEVYPNVDFAVTQDRRTFYFGVQLNGKDYYNRVLWSEPDKPSVIPGGNTVLINNLPGEKPKGIAAVRGGLLALCDRSSHFIRMTGEPVTYDAEEGKFFDGCIASESVVTIEETPFWCGIDGIKIFDGIPKDLTENVLRTGYKSLIASEHSGNNNSYEGIVGAYSKKQNLIVWTFPNSTLTIGDLDVKLLAYHPGKGFFFLESDKDFTWLFEGYSGELYGVDEDGIYELFADTPTESNRLKWTGGILMTEMGDVFIQALRAVYNGTPTINLYADRNATAAFSEVLDVKTSVGLSPVIYTMAQGSDIQLEVESESSVLAQELGKVEMVVEELALG